MLDFRLIGTIKNGEFIKISSRDFEQDKFLDITLKSDKIIKKWLKFILITQPLLSEYSFLMVCQVEH